MIINPYFSAATSKENPLPLCGSHSYVSLENKNGNKKICVENYWQIRSDMGAKAKKSLKKKLNKPPSSSKLSVSVQKNKEASDFLVRFRCRISFEIIKDFQFSYFVLWFFF